MLEKDLLVCYEKLIGDQPSCAESDAGNGDGQSVIGMALDNRLLKETYMLDVKLPDRTLGKGSWST